MTFIEKLQSLGFTLNESGDYENYINNNSVVVTLFDGGSVGLVIYNEVTEEETRGAYRSTPPVIRIINKLFNK